MKISSIIRKFLSFLPEYEPDVQRAHLVVSGYFWIVDEKGEPRLLLLKRSPDDPGQFPIEVSGGGVDPDDEGLINALKRELWEETGITDVKIFPYMLPGEVQHFTQRWLLFFKRPATRYVFRFAGLINHKPDDMKVALSPDHVDWALVSMSLEKKDGGITFCDLPSDKQSIARASYDVVFGSSNPMH